ncbi:MAG TPA: NAD(P)/FAD-dependent oxidoreductase [Nitrospiraceae bacterium]|nr:NAD(P)/FAD-dependent oxidoreductase [Nitrospiraceae bacterium]
MRTPMQPVLIIGAGPAGLTAAYELARREIRVLVAERADKVGGLACTESYQGFRFDMGGHRFFTKSKAVHAIWKEMLGAQLLVRPRLSRIYYNRRFFDYPLRPLNVVRNLGLVETLLIAFSYLRWQVFPYRREDTFEQWVTNRFGRRLFQTFFKSYTEKVWGISCSELQAEWAAQRIQDLSLKTVLFQMLGSRRTIKTLIEEFLYPRCGPGMMWEAMKNRIETLGSEVRLKSDITRLHREGGRIRSATVTSGGQTETVAVEHVISSMPVTELLKRLSPAPPESIATAVSRLRYRDFFTVCLIVNRRHLFADNWIYVHDPSVKVGRIQNYKNWSPDMVPDQNMSSLGLEYFCQENDALWSRSDSELVELGKQEVERIGIARAADIEDGCVFRVPKAYPVYDATYRDALDTVRTFLASMDNLQTIGRNGLHRYNNQDHSMLTAMLAVRNLVDGEQHDLWSVNADAEYHEEIRPSRNG